MTLEVILDDNNIGAGKLVYSKSLCSMLIQLFRRTLIFSLTLQHPCLVINFWSCSGKPPLHWVQQWWIYETFFPTIWFTRSCVNEIENMYSTSMALTLFHQSRVCSDPSCVDWSASENTSEITLDHNEFKVSIRPDTWRSWWILTYGLEFLISIRDENTDSIYPSDQHSHITSFPAPNLVILSIGKIIHLSGFYDEIWIWHLLFESYDNEQFNSTILQEISDCPTTTISSHWLHVNFFHLIS